MASVTLANRHCSDEEQTCSTIPPSFAGTSQSQICFLDGAISPAHSCRSFFLIGHISGGVSCSGDGVIDAFFSNAGSCTSGSFVQADGDVGRGNVALVAVAPADAGPAVAFVLLHHGELLPLLHGDGAFTGAWGETR